MEILQTVLREAERRLQSHVKSLSMPDLEGAIRDGKYPGCPPRIYVPAGAVEQYQYYLELKEKDPGCGIIVEYLPIGSDAEIAQKLRYKPGILALDLERTKHGLRPRYYLVPGGRFNEMYRWDTVFVSYAYRQPWLLEDIIHNFSYMVEGYGAILNANRTYYLNRMQPPMETGIVMHYLDVVLSPNLELVMRALAAIVKEYETKWMSGLRYNIATGLSRYQPNNVGIPTECEPGHFDSILKPHAIRHGVTVDVLIEKYNQGFIQDAEIDEFVLNDAAMRESGRDTTSRFGDNPAGLLHLCLNCHLYKLENDVAYIIKTRFGGECEINGKIHRSADWESRAELRKQSMNEHMICPETGIFYDYNIQTGQLHRTISTSNILPMYAGVASEEQARAIVETVVPQLLQDGGLMSTAFNCKQAETHKQWDTPYGWLPDQWLALRAFLNYGYNRQCIDLGTRCIRRICDVYAMTGLFFEKYDVTDLRSGHDIDAEYGNQINFGFTMAGVLVISELINKLSRALNGSDDENRNVWEDICSVAISNT